MLHVDCGVLQALEENRLKAKVELEESKSDLQLAQAKVNLMCTALVFMCSENVLEILCRPLS